MSRKTRAEKREEERRIIAQMEEGLKENASTFSSSEKEEYTGGNKKKRHANAYDETMPEKIHCKRCKTLMENGVCPTCGYKIYVPMDKKKRDKISLIVAVVCMVAFLVVFIALQVKNS